LAEVYIESLAKYILAGLLVFAKGSISKKEIKHGYMNIVLRNLFKNYE